MLIITRLNKIKINKSTKKKIKYIKRENWTREEVVCFYWIVHLDRSGFSTLLAFAFVFTSSLIRFRIPLGSSAFGTLTMLLDATKFWWAEYLLSSRILGILFAAPCFLIWSTPDTDFIKVDVFISLSIFDVVCCCGCCFDRKLGNFGIRNFPDLRFSDWRSIIIIRFTIDL